ncbi:MULTISPECIES: nuclear transport factor 2 family protein [Enterococcus]|uniref:Nuclear transport factor 2 family protein n=1 Tax=Enterococcus alishanensis TaxID=1303817 RepID=A0ABS6TH10_9ENTE|nr:nuclear transport factor 2 family protein [Enterococcus alishanensis]MBV7392210.1 nuclear transport factor 2 family protein [Enterococcus alishanensis]
MNNQDYMEIHQLITLADQYANQRKVKEYLALFTEDGEITGVLGSTTGQEQLANFIARTWEKESDDLHLTNSIMITQLTDQTAEATSILLIVEKENKTIADVSQINHRLVKIDGSWKFTQRKIG